MIGIIGAMDVEVDTLKALVENKKTETVSGVEFVTGDLHGQKAVIAKCGIGKVFASLCAQTMIMKYNPECIINVGVGGALSPLLDCADIAVAESLVQHDMDTTAIGDPIGLISGINIVNIPTDKKLSEELITAVKQQGINCISGVIASGDIFVSTSQKKDFIRDTFNAVVCEMEGAAIAQVCYVNDVPVAVVRAVSDKADGSAEKDYPSFVAEASANTSKVMEYFCKNRK